MRQDHAPLDSHVSPPRWRWWRTLILIAAVIAIAWLVDGRRGAAAAGAAGLALLFVTLLQMRFPATITPGVATTIFMSLGLGYIVLSASFSWWLVILLVAYILINISSVRMQDHWDNSRPWWS